MRERQGLVYSIQSYIKQFVDTGMMAVYAVVAPEHIDLVISSILTELSELKRSPVCQTELKAGKEFLKGSVLLKLESTKGVAFWTGWQELLLNHILTVDDVMTAIDAITESDIQRVAQRLFVTEKLNLAIIGPFKDEARFATLLESATL